MGRRAQPFAITDPNAEPQCHADALTVAKHHHPGADYKPASVHYSARNDTPGPES